MKRLCTGFNLIILFFALIITLGMYACCAKDSCTRSSWRFSITFPGFSFTEVEPIILKRYVKDNSFSRLRDSTIFTGNNIGQLLEENGSKRTPFIEEVGNDSTDYEIVCGNQSVGIHYGFLSNMVFTEGPCKSCRGTYQIYSLSAYRLNGVYQTSPITIQR